MMSWIKFADFQDCACAQLILSLSTSFKILSCTIKFCYFAHVLLILPIAQLEERQTVVLKVVGSNPAW